MAFNGSFRDGEIEEDEEEINLNDLAKMKENESSIDNIQRYNSSNTLPQNNNIFNSIFTTEIDNNDNQTKLEFFRIQLIKEKINYSLFNLIRFINNRINKHKLNFIYKLKYIQNQKYEKLIKAEILYMNIKTKLDHFFYLFQFINSMKIKKAFNKIKNYSYLKKRQQNQEQIIKKEKENKIQNLNSKLNSITNNLNDAKGKINILNNIQKKN